MAAHSNTQSVTIPPVPADQPPSGWAAWFRDIARSLNLLSVWARAPILTPFTFDTLPAEPQMGTVALITDGSGGPVGPAAGGGSSVTLVWYTGTAWRVFATS
jgi:hypothetical protein